MSDLSISLEALERSRTQLSVSSYFDASLFQKEQELIFQHAPRYLGHELAVPEVGDHLALLQEEEGRALVRTAQGIELVSNVCRHRQAIMLKGRGNAGSHIVCPLHRWTYDLHGELVGAPHFEQDPCLNLRNYPVQSWQGLMFEHNGRSVATDLAALGEAHKLDFSGYVFDRAHLHQCDYNWKTFIEVYLEAPFTPAWADSSVAKTCVGNSASTTRCRPWACKSSCSARARPCMRGGTKPCCAFAMGNRRRKVQSG